MELFRSTAGRLLARTRRKAERLSSSNCPRWETVRPSNRKLRRKRLTSQLHRAFELAASGIDITTTGLPDVCRHTGANQNFLKLSYAQFFRCCELDPGAGVQSNQIDLGFYPTDEFRQLARVCVGIVDSPQQDILKGQALAVPQRKFSGRSEQLFQIPLFV